MNRKCGSETGAIAELSLSVIRGELKLWQLETGISMATVAFLNNISLLSGWRNKKKDGSSQ